MSEIVVADKHRAIRVEGAYDKKNSILVRKGMKVLKGYVDDINESTKENGVYFVIDKDATEEFYEKQSENAELRKAKAELGKVSATDLIDIIVKGGTKKEVEDLSSIPLEEMKVPQLRQYAKENNIAINGTKKEVIIAQILEAQKS